MEINETRHDQYNSLIRACDNIIQQHSHQIGTSLWLLQLEKRISQEIQRKERRPRKKLQPFLSVRKASGRGTV